MISCIFTYLKWKDLGNSLIWGGGGYDSTDSILSSYNEWYFDFNNAIVGVMIPQMI